MVEENKQFTKYKAAIEYMKLDREYLWKTFSIFLVVHTIFLAFIFQSVVGKKLIPGPVYGGIFLASVSGLFLCGVWLWIYKRSLAIYQCRRNQVKNAEPDGWNLLEGEGNDKNPLNSQVLVEDLLGAPIFFFAIFYFMGAIITGNVWTP